MSFDSLSAYALAWAGIIAGIWLLFEKTEEAVKPEIKVATARWLQNLDPHHVAKGWPEQFAAVFDSVFGERHLSWTCFRRSCLASLSSVLIMVCFWWTLYGDTASRLYEKYNKSAILLILGGDCGRFYN